MPIAKSRGIKFFWIVIIGNFISPDPRKNKEALGSPEVYYQQEIEIWGNGSMLGKVTLKKLDGNHIEVILPDQVMVNPIFNLEFRSINPVSPKNMGLGTDERLLGIGLQSIQFAR